MRNGRKNKFFSKKQFNSNVDEIIVLGHSLSDIDFPYFEETAKVNKNKAGWKFGCREKTDKNEKRIKDFAKKLNIRIIKIDKIKNL